MHTSLTVKSRFVFMIHVKGFAMSTEEDTEKEWQKQRVKGWRSSASEEGEQKEEAQNETHPRGQRERVKTLSTG